MLRNTSFDNNNTNSINSNRFLCFKTLKFSIILSLLIYSTYTTFLSVVTDQSAVKTKIFNTEIDSLLSNKTKKDLVFHNENLIEVNTSDQDNQPSQNPSESHEENTDNTLESNNNLEIPVKIVQPFMPENTNEPSSPGINENDTNNIRDIKKEIEDEKQINADNNTDKTPSSKKNNTDKDKYDPREFLKFEEGDLKISKDPRNVPELKGSVTAYFSEDTNVKEMPDIETYYFIAHSHTDLGWIATVETYYENYVRNILSSTVLALYDNKHRKFAFSDVGYLKIWLEDMKESKNKELIEKFYHVTQNKQFEIVNGAVSMNDNACPNWEDIIEDYYYGNKYLVDNNIFLSKVGWHVDPFGHSASMPILLEKMGYYGFIINRIHYQDKVNRMQNKNLEFLWAPTNKTLMLTHILSDHYSPPKSMEIKAQTSPVYHNNIKNRFSPWHNEFLMIFGKVQSLKTEIAAQNIFYIQQKSFIPLGDDFTFVDAKMTYDHIDAYFSIYNSNPRRFDYTKVDYISALDYMKKLANDKILSNKTYGDFFPYADNQQSYWTGYYTTRPHFKRQVKVFGQVFRAFKQIFAKQILFLDKKEATTFLEFYKDEVFNFFDEYGNKLGILNHHDAISGTSPELTVIDYNNQKMDILNKSSFYLSTIVNDYLYQTTKEPNFIKTVEEQQNGGRTTETLEVKFEQEFYSKNKLAKQATDNICILEKGEVCRISVIDYYGVYTIKIYNPTTVRKELIKVRVPENLKWVVTDSNNNVVAHDIICSTDFKENFDLWNKSFELHDNIAPCLIYFVAELNGYQFNFYKIRLFDLKKDPVDISKESSVVINDISQEQCKSYKMADGVFLKINCVAKNTPEKFMIYIEKTNRTFRFDIDYRYYTEPMNTSAHSGHYLFVHEVGKIGENAPYSYISHSDPGMRWKKPQYNNIIAYVKGNLVNEIYILFADQILTRLRFVKGIHDFDILNERFYFDIETTLRPITKDGKSGMYEFQKYINKDLVVNYCTDLIHNSIVSDEKEEESLDNQQENINNSEKGQNNIERKLLTQNQIIEKIQNNTEKNQNTKEESQNTENSAEPNLKEYTEFYTDANGLIILKRIFGQKDTIDIKMKPDEDLNVNGNYYPVTSAIFIQSTDILKKNIRKENLIQKYNRFTIVTDRSQGGTSRYHGMIELMINRNARMQDNRGVPTPYINDKGLNFTQKALFEFGAIKEDLSFYREIQRFVDNIPLVMMNEKQGRNLNFETKYDSSLRIDKRALLENIQKKFKNMKFSFEFGYLKQYKLFIRIQNAHDSQSVLMNRNEQAEMITSYLNLVLDIENIQSFEQMTQNYMETYNQMKKDKAKVFMYNVNTNENGIQDNENTFYYEPMEVKAFLVKI